MEQIIHKASSKRCSNRFWVPAKCVYKRSSYAIVRVACPYEEERKQRVSTGADVTARSTTQACSGRKNLLSSYGRTATCMRRDACTDSESQRNVYANVLRQQHSS